NREKKKENNYQVVEEEEDDDDGGGGAVGDEDDICSLFICPEDNCVVDVEELSVAAARI
ncbi:unnamed protein product, partial [Rotaria magnacalcarata]